ncbi:hypothetical protein PAEPH01_2661, partial [Pancytospora epiphaga]
TFFESLNEIKNISNDDIKTGKCSMNTGYVDYSHVEYTDPNEFVNKTEIPVCLIKKEINRKSTKEEVNLENFNTLPLKTERSGAINFSSFQSSEIHLIRERVENVLSEIKNEIALQENTSKFYLVEKCRTSEKVTHRERHKPRI